MIFGRKAWQGHRKESENEPEVKENTEFHLEIKAGKSAVDHSKHNISSKHQEPHCGEREKGGDINYQNIQTEPCHDSWRTQSTGIERGVSKWCHSQKNPFLAQTSPETGVKQLQ